MLNAAVTTDVMKIEIRQVPEPEPAADEVVLRVEKVGICGTDLHVYDGSYTIGYPVVLGHELSAIVERVDDQRSTGLSVGDRVAVEPVIPCGTCGACRRGRRNACQNMIAIGLQRAGGFQERITVPAANCHPVGDLSAEISALAETLSISHRAITRPGVTAEDSVLVLGARPIGLGAVIAARDAGARVMVLDQHESRLALARELGAEETVADLADLADRVCEWTDDDGATVVIEATGAPVVAQAAFDVVAYAGRIAMVGVSESQMTVGIRPFTKKEIDVLGCKATLDFPAAIALAGRNREAVEKLVSHRFPLAQADEAIRFALDNPDKTVKTLIEVS